MRGALIRGTLRVRSFVTANNSPSSPGGILSSSYFPFLDDVLVLENVITTDEETSLYDSFKNRLERRRFQSKHWDSVIFNYREVEMLDQEWSEKGKEIIHRVRSRIEGELSLPSSISWMSVHVLDLAKDGFINSHVDSIKFSGGLVCGLSLFSPTIMTLKPDTEQPLDGTTIVPSSVCHMYLPPLSLYILKGAARYKYGHSVRSPLDDDVHKVQIPRERRVSLIFRDVFTPPSDRQENLSC